jgi:hypothetical protein
MALLISVLAGSWLLLNAGPDTTDAEVERFIVGSITLELDGDVITLLGLAPSPETARELSASLAARADVAVVINQLEMDVAAPAPSVATLHAGLDALNGTAGSVAQSRPD